MAIEDMSAVSVACPATTEEKNSVRYCANFTTRTAESNV